MGCSDLLSFNEYEADCEFAPACPYSGRPGTADVGICKTATHCGPEGDWVECAGEVTPEVERCGPEAVDENCDGEPNCTGVLRWSLGFGGTGAPGVESIAVDSAGNVFFAGSLSGATNFGGEVLESAGQTDIFVASLDAAGNHRFSRRFGGIEDDAAFGVAVTPAGEVIVTGYFRGVFSEGALSLTSAGLSDIFVMKLDSSGNPLWMKGFGDIYEQAGNAVSVDPDGNIVVVGEMNGSVNFGADVLASAGSSDAFVAKLSPSGEQVFAQRFGGIEYDRARSVAIDGDGNIVVGGRFGGEIQLGGLVYSPQGLSDALLMKLSPAGDTLWGKAFSGAGTDETYSVAVGPKGHVLAAGRATGTIALAGVGYPGYGEDDVFVVKLDSSGMELWGKDFGDTSGDLASAVSVDAADNVVLTGRFRGSVNFGGSLLWSLGDDDGFAVKMDPEGNHVWSKTLGGADSQAATAVAADATGDVLLAGNFRMGLYVDQQYLPNNEGRDVFVVRLGP